MLNYNQIRFWWSGHSGWKTDGATNPLVEKIYDNGPEKRDGVFASNRPQFNVPPGQSKAFLTTGKERVNLLQRSEEFNEAYWTKTDAPITANTDIAPDNTQTADTVTTSGGLLGTIQRSINITANTQTYTTSIHVKKTATDKFGILLVQFTGGTANNTGIQFNKKTGALQYVGNGFGGGFVNFVFADAEIVGDYWRFIVSGANNGTNTNVRFTLNPNRGTSFGNFTAVDDTATIWGAQLEPSTYTTPYIKTTNSSVTIPASNVIIPNAIPATGTILLWDNHTYEPSGQVELLNFNGDGYLAYEEDGIEVSVGGGSPIAVSDKEWQANGVFKPWFYALTYNATTVTVYRGDKEGNLTLALPATAHGGSPSVEDLVLNSTARDSVHLNSDILTTDEQLTQDQITAIYNGSLPIFQTRAYKGDNFDRVRQKVANEVNGTFDQEGVSEARSVAFFDLYSVYHPTAKAYFEYVESEGGVITDRSSLNDDITNFLTQELS